MSLESTTTDFILSFHTYAENSYLSTADDVAEQGEHTHHEK
jgi:hypothetical protein